MAQVISHQKVAYLGGHCACPTPFQPTIIFYDGIFGCFTNFFLLKHQNLGIQQQKSVSFWGNLSPRPLTGALPLDPTGGTSVPQSLLSHILNMPLAPELCDVNFLWSDEVKKFVLFLFIDAAGCFIRLHGWGMPPSEDLIPGNFYAVETNGIQNLNMTPGLGGQRGFHSYIVDPSTCAASDYQYWEMFVSTIDAFRLINYLQALKNGKQKKSGLTVLYYNCLS